MPNQEALHQLLQKIDGRGYKAYKDLAPVYHFDGFTLHIDHIQGDPFAAPSRMRVRVPQSRAAFPAHTWDQSAANIALCNYLALQVAHSAGQLSQKKGSGKSGLIQIDAPGQQVMSRTCTAANAEAIEARLALGLPAAGRRVLGPQAQQLLCHDLPALVDQALLYANNDPDQIQRWIHTNEDAEALRQQIAAAGLVAFVADNSILPRRSGIDDRPLEDQQTIPFTSPQSLRLTLELPHAGPVSGMGIPAGITLIVGGGFHGKSTLLQALERGVYNHRPQDGRQQVVTDASAVKIRAEDGRRVAGVDISAFISHLPQGRSTERFCTDNASGSTSQAANIVEALEAGSRCLLVDEDTAATNFMIRDRRMQQLVAKEKEPITPFVDRVRQLFEQRGVSTILVMGGCGDYFDCADQIIGMENYRPQDLTAAAKAIAAADSRPTEVPTPLQAPSQRIPLPQSVDPSRGHRPVAIKTRGHDLILFGEESIDLSAVEQLLDPSQTRAIAAALQYARQHYLDGQRDLRAILNQVMEDIHVDGLDILSRRPVGDWAHFRPSELAAALNRLRSLVTKKVQEGCRL